MRDLCTEIADYSEDGGESPGDCAVVVKHGPTPRLRHEADMLRLARHPGVVELLDVEHHDEASTLTLRRAGDRNLGDLDGLPIEVIAGVTAVVAEILADLHGLGITHGRVSVDHIVIDPLGRPVICGWAEGDHHSSAVDGVRARGDEPRRPTSDVADLGALIVRLLETATPVVPGRHLRSRRDAHQAKLAALASRATAPDTSIRPSARALAAAIGEAVPGSRLPAASASASARPPTDPAVNRPGTPVPVEATPDPFEQLRQSATADTRHRVRGSALILTSALIAVTSLATFAGLRLATGGGGPPSGSPDPVTAPSPASASPTSTLGDGDRGTVGAPPSRPVVNHEGHRYEVGEPGDRVLEVATQCTNAPAILLQRPSTGEVFVFASWAEPGEPVEATAVVEIPMVAVPEAIVSAGPDQDRCEVLQLVDQDGSTIEIPFDPAHQGGDGTP